MAKVFGKLELPDNFQKQLLNCQIDRYLNDKIEPYLIRKLIELYSTGLEYYQSIRSYKYLYFQKKMQEIVRSPTIIKSMNVVQIKNQQIPQCLTKSQQKQKIETIQIKQKQQKLVNELISINSGLTSEKIKNIINQNDQKFYQTQEIIRGQISQQQNKLRLKLQQRKLKKQFRNSSKSIGFTDKKSTKQSLFEDEQLQKSSSVIFCDFSNIINEHISDDEREENYQI